MKFNNGYNNIEVSMLDFVGDKLAKKVYEFGRFSHDFYPTKTPDIYVENDATCCKLIDKIIEGTTLPKFAMQGTRITFAVKGISRICLAQLTRDKAIFASAGGGVYPLTQEFNIPMNIYNDASLMSKLTKAQELLEEAYVEACEKEIPALEARYLGLHCQTINICCSYELSDFVRSCYSRTSSNFCDECNYVYRLMYRRLQDYISVCMYDTNSIKLCKWLFDEKKCINDTTYKREHLYNSDFTPDDTYKPSMNAINDWRKSCWKMELERMYHKGNGYLTKRERSIIRNWLDKEKSGEVLSTTYDSNQPYVAKNAIKDYDYYKDVKRRINGNN